MKVIGITGSIGAGKSEISRIFKQHNCFIIDLDKLGHDILEKPEFKKQIVQQFGKYILDKNKISRKKLRKIVFFNSNYLLKLNKIVHPELKNRLKQEINKNKKKKIKAIVVDAALLFEMKIEKLMDIIITVSALKMISYLRLLKNQRLSYSEFDNIYQAQLPLHIKKKKSDYIIHNNLSMKCMRKKAEKLIKKILWENI